MADWTDGEMDDLRRMHGLHAMRGMEVVTPEILKLTHDLAEKMLELNQAMRETNQSTLDRLNYLHGVVLATVFIERGFDLEKV